MTSQIKGAYLQAYHSQGNQQLYYDSDNSADYYEGYHSNEFGIFTGVASFFRTFKNKLSAQRWVVYQQQQEMMDYDERADFQHNTQQNHTDNRSTPKSTSKKFSHSGLNIRQFFSEDVNNPDQISQEKMMGLQREKRFMKLAQFGFGGKQQAKINQIEKDTKSNRENRVQENDEQIQVQKAREDSYSKNRSNKKNYKSKYEEYQTPKNRQEKAYKSEFMGDTDMYDDSVSTTTTSKRVTPAIDCKIRVPQQSENEEPEDVIITQLDYNQSRQIQLPSRQLVASPQTSSRNRSQRQLYKEDSRVLQNSGNLSKRKQLQRTRQDGILIESPERQSKKSKCNVDYEQLPFVLDNYRLFLYRCGVTLFFVYYVFKIAYAVHSDLNNKHQTEFLKLNQQVQACRSDYYKNRCQPDMRVEQLESYCMEKELCMNQPLDTGVKNLSTLVSLLVEIINSTSEQLTYTSIGVLCMFLVTIIFVSRYLTQPSQQPMIIQQSPTPSKNQQLQYSPQKSSRQLNY